MSGLTIRAARTPNLNETIKRVEVWRQALVENAKAVKVGGESYPVRRTPKHGWRQVDFVFDGNNIRGLEQNPDTTWVRVFATMDTIQLDDV